MTELTLANRSIIITGAASGIGRAAALDAAAQGAHVIISDLNEEASNSAVEEITSQGGAATAVVGDISQQEVVDRLVETANAAAPLRGLVNNAGVMDLFSGAGETDDATWERCIRVNLTGPFLLTRAALPSLRKNGGSIVNVASEAALRGAAAGAAYTSSKHGLIGLTKSTAYRYAKEGVRCNAILPGGVETNMLYSIDMTKIDQEAMAVLGVVHGGAIRNSTADEQAALILFLLSDAASNVSGALISSDAGWAAG